MKYLIFFILLLFSCSVFGQVDRVITMPHNNIDLLDSVEVDNRPIHFTNYEKYGVLDLQLPTEKPQKRGYQITKTKLIGWTVLGVAGFVDGAVEGYDFDDRVAFEQLYGADPYGFWGSESWRKIYNNGRKADGCKTWLGCSLGAWDFYHVADDTRKLGYISGGIVLGAEAGKQKLTHTLLDFAIGFTVGAVTKNLGMKYIRSWK